MDQPELEQDEDLEQSPDQPKPGSRWSLFHRLTASGFILLIICGNFLIVEQFLGRSFSSILIFGAQLGGGIVMIGGVGLVWRNLRRSEPKD